MNYQTHFNTVKDAAIRCEKISKKPSLTIPGHTMPLAEIMRRYASGIPIPGMREAVYNGEEDLPDFERMDISERAEWLQTNREHMTQLEEDHKFNVRKLAEQRNKKPEPQKPEKPDETDTK